MEENSLVPRTNIASPVPAAFFALDFSSSMRSVASSVVKGYENCRQEWSRRIPDAMFLPAGFNSHIFLLTDYAVMARDLPIISEEQYLQRLKGGSILIDVFQFGLTLALKGKVNAIFVMSDGWNRKSLGNYFILKDQYMAKARELGCLIRLLIYYNPKYEKQLWEFIRMSGLEENEYIIFRNQEVQTGVEKVMDGLRDEVIKAHLT